MSAETRDDGADRTETGAQQPDERNQVAVHFENGDVAHYAFVVREDVADWLYAERLEGNEDGFDFESVEAIRADAVYRINSGCVHLFDGGVVHFGPDLLVDPATLLDDSWFDARDTLL